MNAQTDTKRRILSMLLALALCFSLVVVAAPSTQALDEPLWWEQYQDITADSPLYNPTAPGVDLDTGKVTSTGQYILFTSDTHSCGYLAKDLLEYANTIVQAETGDENAYVGLMAFGGDFADYGLLPETMTTLHIAIESASPNTVAVYTKGNHEMSFTDEQFQKITGMPRIGETALNENYHFYSFGVDENQAFTARDIEALDEYLGSLKDNKPVFVISHFPIHYLNDHRSCTGAKDLLDVLNKYPQVVFSWGHNHSEADPSYGTVRFPGETLTYGPNASDTVELNFTYMSNGSLRYANNEENGVLVKVNGDGTMNFRFICLDQQQADDRVWKDSAGTTFETYVAGTPYVKTYITDKDIDSDDYKVINCAQAFIDRPKVNSTPATLDGVTTFSNRYEATDITWLADGEPFTGSTFTFSTAYTAEVTLKATEGHTFASDISEQHVTGINPSYKGPMGENYTVGVSDVKWIDESTIVIDYTFDRTAEGFETPITPASEIREGCQYVLASNDETSVSAYYKYAYQAGARQQSYQIAANSVVIMDGKLASKNSDFETWTAVKETIGYLLTSDASLLDHSDGDLSIATINILNAQFRGGSGSLDTSVGSIYLYNNWNIDENGLPYLNDEGTRYYPCATTSAITVTSDPTACNMRLYEVSEEETNRYIVESNVTAPVTGETPVTIDNDGNPVVWTPADKTFQPDTEYTATVTVPLSVPLANTSAAIARMNGMDVTLEVAEDGKSATVSYTFPATNKNSVSALNMTATKAAALEDGKAYIIVADGKAMTSKTTADGRYLLAADVTVSGDRITSVITTDMLYYVEEKSEDLFYISNSEGYLIGRKETADAKETWGITTTDAPAMTVTYADGALSTKDTGVQTMSFGEPAANYFYLYDGHINISESLGKAAVEIYEVTVDNPFTDVAADAFYRDAVVWAVDHNVTYGATATTFEPQSKCTRAQVVSFLYRAAGEPAYSVKNPFTDVHEDDYYYDAVLWAYENHITYGTTATTFEPGGTCTRGQVVEFLYRVAKTPAVTEVSPFKDVDKNAYYYDAVNWAYQNEITYGTSATTFEPETIINRAEAVSFIYRTKAE